MRKEPTPTLGYRVGSGTVHLSPFLGHGLRETRDFNLERAQVVLGVHQVAGAGHGQLCLGWAALRSRRFAAL
jgi:hypothetical protein